MAQSRKVSPGLDLDRLAHSTRAPILRCNVLGVGVHALDMATAVAVLLDAVREQRQGYVCVTGVHGVSEAQADENLREILNRSLLTTPDGMPVVWMGRLQGFSAIEQVRGIDLVLEVCKSSVAGGWSHFFYGGAPGTASALGHALRQRVPGLNIVGSHSPPFRDLTPGEEEALVATVRDLRPDFFWVGISTPKQERFMAKYLGRLETRVMIGIGAAFDVHTGAVRDAPRLVRRAGLQWLHRLAQDPRRLWKRYAVNNPAFVGRALLQLSGLRRYDLATTDQGERTT